MAWLVHQIYIGKYAVAIYISFPIVIRLWWQADYRAEQHAWDVL